MSAHHPTRGQRLSCKAKQRRERLRMVTQRRSIGAEALFWGEAISTLQVLSVSWTTKRLEWNSSKSDNPFLVLSSVIRYREVAR